jgi:hypothetical protein
MVPSTDKSISSDHSEVPRSSPTLRETKSDPLYITGALTGAVGADANDVDTGATDSFEEDVVVVVVVVVVGGGGGGDGAVESC